MISTILRLVRRNIDDVKHRGSMEVGLPKVAVDLDKLEYMCKYIEVARENEWLYDKINTLVEEKTGEIHVSPGGNYRALVEYIEKLEANQK